MKIVYSLTFCIACILLQGCVAIFTPKRVGVSFTWTDPAGKVNVDGEITQQSGKKVKIANWSRGQYTFATYTKEGYKPVNIPLERRRFNKAFFLDWHPLLLVIDAFLGSSKSVTLGTRKNKVDDTRLIQLPYYEEPRNFVRNISFDSRGVIENITFFNRIRNYNAHVGSNAGQLNTAMFKNPYLKHFKDHCSNELRGTRDNYIKELKDLNIYKAGRDVLSVAYNRFDLDVSVDSISIEHVGLKSWTNSYYFSSGIAKSRVCLKFVLTNFTGETIIDTTISTYGNFDYASNTEYLKDAFKSAFYIFLAAPNVKKMFLTDQEPGYADKLQINKAPGPVNVEQAVNSTVTLTSGKSLSSGCIISGDGYILTNLASIEDTKNIQVMLSNERRFKAQLVRQSAKMNTALIKIDTTGLIPLEINFKPEEYLAQQVFIAGTPIHSNLHNSLSRGFLSAVRKTDDWKFVQTSAVMSKGHKGGAILSSSGQLLAILNHRVKSSSTSKISFGISMEDVCRALKIEFSK